MIAPRTLEEAAAELGRARRLLRDDGTWLCWCCGRECPFHVSLHCAGCRGGRYVARALRADLVEHAATYASHTAEVE